MYDISVGGSNTKPPAPAALPAVISSSNPSVLSIGLPVDAATKLLQVILPVLFIELVVLEVPAVKSKCVIHA